MASLRDGQVSAFQRTRRELEDYLIAPYLDYHYLRGRLGSVSNRTVQSFLDRQSHLPAARILRTRWLKELGRSRQWQTFLEHYPVPEKGQSVNDEVNCYYLRALYGTGQQDLALRLATETWSQGESQPKACDPLFEVWRNTTHFTESVVWTRLGRALDNNEVTLSRYLLRYFQGGSKLAAEAFYASHVTPTRLTRLATYNRDQPRYREILTHSLPRLARREPEKAQELWKTYRGLAFSIDQIGTIVDALAVGLAQKRAVFPPPEEREMFQRPETIEKLAEIAVQSQAWDEAAFWIEAMPLTRRQDSRWQYWLARVLHETMGPNQRSELAFRSLATQRHYYGFLAAQRLGLPGALNGTVQTNDRTKLVRVRTRPGLQRSLELFAVEDAINGRREWYRVLEELNAQEGTLAGLLAQENGLLTLAIRTANNTGAHDNLALRFPLAYEPHFRLAGLKVDLPPATLFAVARQESAFDHRARSSANARGLMQLLPSTAKIVARRHHHRNPTTSSLYDPGTNITLGSSHLAWLMQRFDGQSALAIAAYNAGEHRVDRWIKDSAGMPIDIWIERIPFRETRNYVKNVLAFRHVYAQMLNSSLPFLSHREMTVAAPG